MWWKSTDPDLLQRIDKLTLCFPDQEKAGNLDFLKAYFCNAKKNLW